MSNCKLEETNRQPTLSMKITTSVNSLIKDLKKGYAHIDLYLDELGEVPVGPPYTAYYNWEGDSIEVELGYPVKKALPGKGCIFPYEIPSGKKATLMYYGRLQKIAPSYKSLNTWIEKSGYQAGVNYEFYYNLLENVPDEQLVTKISYIITKI